MPAVADAHAGDLVHKEAEELERALEAVEQEAGEGGGEPSVVVVPVDADDVLMVAGEEPAAASAEMEASVYSQLAQGVSLETAISSVLSGQQLNTLNQLLTRLGDAVPLEPAS